MDIRILWDPSNGTGDFNVVNGALELGHDLETAVLISLNTDRLADPDDILPPGQAVDRRGWWADTYEGDPIGSKLWQAFWRPTTQETLNWARDTATKALQWMIDDGVAASVTVNSMFVGKGTLALNIVVVQPGGRTFRFTWSQEG